MIEYEVRDIVCDYGVYEKYVSFENYATKEEIQQKCKDCLIATDLIEVKRGYIIEHPGYEDGYYCLCSVCGTKEVCMNDKFCSECGAILQPSTCSSEQEKFYRPVPHTNSKVVLCGMCKNRDEQLDGCSNTTYLQCKLSYGLRGTVAPTDYCSYGKLDEEMLHHYFHIKLDYMGDDNH